MLRVVLAYALMAAMVVIIVYAMTHALDALWLWIDRRKR